jgi:hypothetical protein
MVIKPKRKLDREWVKTPPALAPINIVVADSRSNLAYWQPTMRSAFCGLLANSTGIELRAFNVNETLSGGLLGTSFPKRYRAKSQIF